MISIDCLFLEISLTAAPKKIKKAYSCLKCWMVGVLLPCYPSWFCTTRLAQNTRYSWTGFRWLRSQASAIAFMWQRNDGNNWKNIHCCQREKRGWWVIYFSVFPRLFSALNNLARCHTWLNQTLCGSISFQVSGSRFPAPSSPSCSGPFSLYSCFKHVVKMRLGVRRRIESAPVVRNLDNLSCVWWILWDVTDSQEMGIVIDPMSSI